MDRTNNKAKNYIHHHRKDHDGIHFKRIDADIIHYSSKLACFISSLAIHQR